MKIVSYLLNKLNGFRIGIDEDGNAQLISYRNHPFTNTGGGAKRVEAFVEPGENANQLKISQGKYNELNVGDVLVVTLLGPQGGTDESIVAFNALGTKIIVYGPKFTSLVPSVPYPVECLVFKDGEMVADEEVTKGNDKYLAAINIAHEEPFTAAYDILFGLDATLIKLERCDSSFEPTEVVSEATLAVKTVEAGGASISCPCLSFNDNVTIDKDTYYYKATTSDSEINFSISYQGMA